MQENPLRVQRNLKTLREMALETMRGAILGGHFLPGERLVERQLCEQLDVSRSIVREVLRHLEAEGLVDTQGQGPVVATVDADQAMQIYQVRALLEGHAARTCAMTASDAELKTLHSLNKQTQEAFAKGDFELVRQRTSAFYETLFKVSGMTVAWDVVQSLNARINRLRALTISAPGRSAEAEQEMADILVALERRDPDAAEQASRRHVMRAAEIASARLPADEAQGGRSKKPH